MDALTANPLDSGFVLIILMGALGTLFYKIWGPLKSFLRFRFTTVFEVTSADPSFWWILNWLEQQECRTNSWRTREYYIKGKRKVRLGPGKGYRILRYKGHRIVATMSEETLDNTIDVRERLTLQMWGNTKHIIKKIVKEAKRMGEPDPRVELDIFRAQPNGSWYRSARIPKRSRDTIYLTEEQEEIFEDAVKFCESKDWYLKRGVPYRRGYLLAGKPGTGKSSVAHTLASYLDKPLYVISGTATDFAVAFSDAPDNVVLLIEDIDTGSVSKSREIKPDDMTQSLLKDIASSSLVSLLNAIDGVAAGEGRILLMTTNHKEKLDAALIRPGRCDKIIEFGDPTDVQLEAMKHNLLDGKEIPDTYNWEDKKASFKNMAEAQEFLLELAISGLFMQGIELSGAEDPVSSMASNDSNRRTYRS